MAFVLPPLPFDQNALVPHMSAETLQYHHGKHHNAYVVKTNELVQNEQSLAGAALTDVIRAAKQSGNNKLFNNSAQIWNHSFFWQCLAPKGSTQPNEALQALIDRDFGSTEALLKKLGEESVNHFGSGWGWLVLDGEKLKVTSYHDADTPVGGDLKPLLTLDVWEHAYYIDYRNERPRFASTVLANIVNWDFVAQNLDGQGFERANQGEGASAELAS